MSQKSCIIKIIIDQIGDRYSIKTPARQILNDLDMEVIYSKIIEQIRNGTIVHSTPSLSDSDLRKYVVSTVLYHMRHEQSLNGGISPKSLSAKDTRLVGRVQKMIANDEQLDVEGYLADYLRRKTANLQD